MTVGSTVVHCLMPMDILARATGPHRLSDFCVDDLTTFKRDMAYLSGVAYGGVVPL